MKIMNPGIYFYEDEFDSKKLKRLERAARLCYKSKTGAKDIESFLRDKCDAGHESVIEHEKVTLYFVCDRGISHEIVRHRVGSYSQESTRYCNYSNDKHNNRLTFINIPEELFHNKKSYNSWVTCLKVAEDSYLDMIKEGTKPQIARSILPHSVKTEIAITYNIREWRHFFKLRCDKAAHPQMRQIATRALQIFKEKYPALFADILVPEDNTIHTEKVWIYSAQNDDQLDQFIDEFINGDKSDIQSTLNI